MANEYCSPLDITQIENNFAEIHPAFSSNEAMHEANRCLYCYDAPCIQACPTGIDVPSFIKKIATGNLLGSARVIFDANPIGASCARVCPVEVLCEGACVEKTLLHKPIEIGRLQRHATDFALVSEKPLFAKGEPNGKSVGIVGSGPAGLSCATYLARLGYAVTVYERREQPGGLDTYGMAEYKMSKSVSLAEVEQVKRLGVEFRLNTAIGGDVSFDELRSSHDAIFLAVGLGETNKLNILGEELDGVYDALHLIEKIKTRDWKGISLGKTVAVIGAGNTAIDAVTQAKRLGAEKVILIYRRTETEAPAYDYEFELARKDGVEFMWKTIPVEIGGISSVSGLRLRNESGEFKIDCDMVIKAIGQTKMASFFSDVAGVAVDEKGRVVVNAQMQTSDPKIFAGGDCANGGKEAVDASQMGKRAAMGIHTSLTGEKVTFAGAARVKPKDAIRQSLREYVLPRLARLEFSFSDSSLDFKRKDGKYVQKISTHLEKWNAEDVSAEFYFSFSVRSNFYVKWHQKEYGTRPVNDFLASEMYWNLRGWKHPRPNVAFKEYAEREMLLLLDDTLEVGLPFLEKYSDWENAALRFVEERWFHAKACDFYLIAGNKERAEWCLEKAFETWKLQPNRSFFVGEKEDVILRLEKHFGRKVEGD